MVRPTTPFPARGIAFPFYVKCEIAPPPVQYDGWRGFCQLRQEKLSLAVSSHSVSLSGASAGMGTCPANSVRLVFLISIAVKIIWCFATSFKF